jgi:hypothetical protein
MAYDTPEDTLRTTPALHKCVTKETTICSSFCVCVFHYRDRAATARRALAQKGTKPTSAYRGVTHHVRTGRWEAHIWLDGKQVGCVLLLLLLLLLVHCQHARVVHNCL